MVSAQDVFPFHPFWFEEPAIERIIELCTQALKKARRRCVDAILGAGLDRGGSQHVGGPLWMDWGNLIPIPGINQVVGHTPGSSVREKMTRKSRNYCLDVGNGAVAAILTDGKLEILTGA